MADFDVDRFLPQGECPPYEPIVIVGDADVFTSKSFAVPRMIPKRLLQPYAGGEP